EKGATRPKAAAPFQGSVGCYFLRLRTERRAVLPRCPAFAPRPRNEIPSTSARWRTAEAVRPSSRAVSRAVSPLRASAASLRNSAAVQSLRFRVAGEAGLPLSAHFAFDRWNARVV